VVVDMKIVHGDEDLLMVSDDGTIIRTDVGTVSIYGRATQGVRLMRVAQDSRVISIACTEKEDDEEETDTVSAPETQSAQDTSVQTESEE
jgi:DNA gyrase subunit A